MSATTNNDNPAAAAVSSISAIYNETYRVAPGAVGIQLALMAVLGIGAVAAFSILRPNNSVVYQPKVKYSEDEKRPPKLDKGLLSWVKPVLQSKESTLMQTIGLDAVAYLRYLRMCRNIFIITAVLTCAVLIPINVTYNFKYISRRSRNWLLMLTINSIGGTWLWAHVVMTYVLTAVAFFFIWRNWASVVRLRWEWFRSDEYQNTLHARSLIITQVRKAYQTDQGLHQLLQSLAIPYPTSAVQIGRRVGTLPELIKRHNDAVRQLEGVLTTHLKDPNNVPTKRPTMRIGGFMKMGGKKVDAIDYLTQKIQRFEERIETTRAQIDLRSTLNYGFASFESVPYAHIVAKKLTGKKKLGSRFDLAPVPQDIIWDNITLTDAARRKNKFFSALLLVVVCALYMIPLVVVSLLANLAALGGLVSFIRTWSDKYPALFAAFIGVVPPLLSVILQLMLPMIIRWIAGLMGATTHSQSDRIVTGRYSAFLIITQFIIFSLLGVLVQIGMKLYSEIDSRSSASEIWQYLRTVPDQFQSTYVVQSSYWLTVFPLRGASALFDLAQFISLFYVWFKTKLFGRTPREIREWTKPPDFDFPVYYSNHVLMSVVAFVYAPLAPLVPLFAAAAFAISMWVYKYQLMYVSVSRVETGGRLWNVAVNRTLVGLIMMHAFMALSVGLQNNWYWSISLAPPAIGVLVFKYLLVRRFEDRFKWYIPSPDEMAEVSMHHADARKNRLQKRFGHPSLHETLFTPMLHKKIQHLLPTLYNGRMAQSATQIEGKTIEQSQIAGLTFNMLETHDLAFDRSAYLAQRDEDAMTVSSADVLGQNTKIEPGESDYFNARKAEYLRHGATTPHNGSESYGYGTPVGTPDDLPFELSRMPTHMGGISPNASTEHLIQYPPTYSSPPSRDPRVPAGASHAHQGSVQSFVSAQSVQELYGHMSPSQQQQQQQQQMYGSPGGSMGVVRSAYAPSGSGAGSPRQPPFNAPGATSGAAFNSAASSPRSQQFQPHHNRDPSSFSSYAARGPPQPRTRTPSPGPEAAYGSPRRQSLGSQMSLDYNNNPARIQSAEIGSPDARASPRTSGQWDRFGPVPGVSGAAQHQPHAAFGPDDTNARLPPGARRG